MEALQNLKRTNALCYNMCIICQENNYKPQPLHASTEQGIARISEATELRKKLRDMKFIETIDRLTAVLQNSTDTTIVWHNACYATYTSREKIERLRKNENEEPAIYQQLGKNLRRSSHQLIGTYAYSVKRTNGKRSSILSHHPIPARKY